LKSKLSDNHTIDSAGTANYHTGNFPDKRSVAVARKYGLDISNLKARQFNVTDFDIFDLIYVMDQSNFKNVVKLARNDEDIAKVKLILNEIHDGKNYEVPDPYYGGDYGFENVYQMLDEACDTITKKLIKN